jgi:glycosyltransferase involved in cell wall biosynthesis
VSKKTRILYLGNQLSKRGFTPTAIEQLGPQLEAEGYEIIYASNKLNKLTRLVDMNTSILKHKNKVDLVLIDTYSTAAFYFAWTAAYVCRKIGLSYIPVLHGGNLPYRMNNSPVLSSQLFANSYTNVALSPYLQKELEQRQFKATLIPNAIDITDYPFKERTQISPSLLWVRSFHQLYHPEMALHVLKQLLNKYPGATLTMVGPDKDGTLQKCKDLSVALDIEKNVQFTGRLNKQDWVKLSEDHDIFINTSTTDNLPFSIIEAMALGMVVVSTNVGGIPHLINDKNGIMIDNGDVIGMVKSIENVLTNNTANEYSKQARATAEQYDWNVVKQKWITLLDSIQAKSKNA